MSGVEVVGTLLRAYDPLIARVALASIKAGALPENIGLPAILLRTTSVVDRQPLKILNYVASVERVSVTVRAASYVKQRELIKMIRRCAHGWTGDLAGVLSVSVRSAGTGPDVTGPNNTYEQTQDFRVSFNEPV